MDDFAISVENVSKHFKLDQRKGFSMITSQKIPKHLKSFAALNGISFKVKKGEILGILGLNGSGKSTLLRIIAGIYQPDSGSVQVNGTLSPLLQLGTGYQGDLNATENILINGMLLGFPKSEIEKKVKKIIEFAELERFFHMNIKHYSSGMRTRLAFSTAMQLDPDIFLVDEILSVGDWIFREKSYKAFLSFKEKNKTILYASHNLDKLADLSDNVLLLHHGKIVMLGEPQVVLQKYRQIKS